MPFSSRYISPYCGPEPGKLHDLLYSQPSGRTQGAGWFPGGGRLGHFPKRGSTLRPHPGKPKALSHLRLWAEWPALNVCAGADPQRLSSLCRGYRTQNPAGFMDSHALEHDRGLCWCPLHIAPCKPLIPGSRAGTPPPPHPASCAASAPPGRRHPYHLLSKQTRLPREGDAETGTALGWGARAKTARALFLRRPRAELGYRQLPSSARGARHRLLCEKRARARPGPLPHGRCPRGRTSGVGEGRKPRGRASDVHTSPPPPPDARGRARASQCRPPLSTRPSSCSGRWGRGCPSRSPFPSRERKRPIRSRLRLGIVAWSSPCFRKRRGDSEKSLRRREPLQLLPGSD